MEENESEPVKKKLKVDTVPPSSPVQDRRLSDQTINDYLEKRKKMSPSFNSTYIFSTYYYEEFLVDGGRTERTKRWSAGNLFDYQQLVIPIFQRQREHWRLAIVTNPRNLLPVGENKFSHSQSSLFVFDSLYDTSIIASETKETVLRILWKHFARNNRSTNLSNLADKNMIVYTMHTCRQSNNVDCGVFMLHFIDEFVGFKGSDKEQYGRATWKNPLDVDAKRREILDTINGSDKGESAASTLVKLCASEEVIRNEDSIFNENGPRFKLTVYPPDTKDMTSLKSPKGLISAPILDHYLSILRYNKSQFVIIPAHYSEMIANCDEDVIAEYPQLISSKYILLPIHRHTHWVLVVIANVACVLGSHRAKGSSCKIFLLDSYHAYLLEAGVFFDLAQNLLKAAVKIHAKKDSFDASRIVTSSLPVVQQNNGYDCGLFLLHNVETFVKSPFSSTEQFTDAQLWNKTFKPNVKRKKLFDKISATLEESSDHTSNFS